MALIALSSVVDASMVCTCFLNSAQNLSSYLNYWRLLNEIDIIPDVGQSRYNFFLNITSLSHVFFMLFKILSSFHSIMTK